MNAPHPIEAHNAATRAFKAEQLAGLSAHKARAHIDGTAYTALRIVQREVLETALRYRNARVSRGAKEAQPHKVALLALLRVRRELRDAYPGAKPYWQSMELAA